MNKFASAALLVASAMAAEGSNWDYKQMGEDWGEVIPLCDSGKQQSPIDLKTEGGDGFEASEDMSVVGLNYFDLPMGNFDKSSTGWKVVFPDVQQRLNAELQLTFADGSQSNFTPRQFHFHAPSEHTVDGKNYDAEVHFVHVIQGSGQDSQGRPTPELYGAVIGIFFDVKEGGSTPNDFLTSMFAGVEDGTKTLALRQFFNTVDFNDYWSYEGSFTTPPCTENIKWTVVKQVQSISPDQLEKFTDRLAGDSSFARGKGNNRVTMPLNDRTIYYSMAAGASAMTSFAAATIAAIAALTF